MPSQKLLSFTALLLISFSSLLAQKKINEGYIITKVADTVRGDIKGFNVKKNSQQCIFRSASSQEFVKYRPGDIISFRYNKKYYVSKKINFEGSENVMFVEFLVEGVLDLFYLQLNNELFYLIEDETGTQTYLKVNSKYPKSNEEILAVSMERSKNLGALNYIMKDYPPIYSDLKNVQIEDSRSMKKLVVAYHEGVCTEYGCIDYTKNYSKIKYHIGIFYGAKNSGLPLESNDEKYLSIQDTTLQPNRSSYYGINFSFNIPRISERLRFNTKMAFSKEEYGYTYQMNYGYGHFEGIGSLSYNYASININFSYDIGSANFKLIPYAGFGLDIMYNYNGSFSEDASQIPHSFTLGNSRLVFNGGLGLDIPISKSIYIRPTFDYRLSLDPRYYYNMFTDKYNSMGISAMMLKYF